MIVKRRAGLRGGNAERDRPDEDPPTSWRFSLACDLPVALLADGQRIRLLITQRALKGASEMCVELGRSIGRRCNLNLPPPSFD